MSMNTVVYFELTLHTQSYCCKYVLTNCCGGLFQTIIEPFKTLFLWAVFKNACFQEDLIKSTETRTKTWLVLAFNGIYWKDKFNQIPSLAI